MDKVQAAKYLLASNTGTTGPRAVSAPVPVKIVGALHGPNPPINMGPHGFQSIDQDGVSPGIRGAGEAAATASISFNSLFDSIENVAEAFVTGGNAGRVFAATMLVSIGGVFSRMGDMLIHAGIGFEFLKRFNGIGAIAAGVALKAIAGSLRGIGANNAPLAAAPRGG